MSPDSDLETPASTAFTPKMDDRGERSRSTQSSESVQGRATSFLGMVNRLKSKNTDIGTPFQSFRDRFSPSSGKETAHPKDKEMVHGQASSFLGIVDRLRSKNPAEEFLELV